MNAKTAVIAPKTISSQIAIPKKEFRTTQTPREHIAKLSSFIVSSAHLLFYSNLIAWEPTALAGYLELHNT